MRPDVRGLAVPALLAVAAAVLLLLGLPGAFGKITAGLANNTNTAASNAYFSCNQALTGSGGNNAYLAYPFNDSAGPTANDVSGNSRAGQFNGGVSYRTTGGPCKRDTDGGYAITLNGSTGYVSGPSTAVAGMSVFSVEIWFRTTVAAGKLIGFGNTRTGASANYDRHLYIDSNGKLIFGVYPGANKTVASTVTVTDGKWHHAVGTLSASGLSLYLDGVLQKTDTTVTTAQAFNGYWRMGYDTLGGGWPNSPSSYYFSGDLAWAEVYSYALTADQAKSHYLAGTGS